MRFKVSGSSCGFGGGFIKLLDTEEDVEDAGDALAGEHDWLRATGGVDVKSGCLSKKMITGSYK